MAIEKTLIGKHLLTGALGGQTYNFSLPTTPAGSNLPNQLANQVIEEVYIAVDTSLGDVNLNLPAISTFNLAWNTKIYIVVLNVDNNFTLYPFSSEVVTNDTLNGSFSISASNSYDAWYLHIVEENTWMSLYCPGPGLIPPPLVNN